MFFQPLLNGHPLGSIYALIALGYTLVYGILEFINFAHGEICRIGDYPVIIALGFLIPWYFNPRTLAPLLVILFALIYAAAIEEIVYRPLRNAPRLSPLISALGVSIFLQNFVMLTQVRPREIPGKKTDRNWEPTHETHEK
ncbi:MAG: hypothetical protein Q8O74_03375 [bacterium]|nr:hypothetical protein [bacterium]